MSYIHYTYLISLEENLLHGSHLYCLYFLIRICKLIHGNLDTLWSEFIGMRSRDGSDGSGTVFV